jgi:hypothetical protein
MKFKIQVALTVAGMMLAFAGGRALAAECSYHQPTCTYRVGGCYPVSGSCDLQGGGTCYIEFGSCCGEPGSDYSKFCAPSCDGSGGGTPCSN